MAKKGLSASNLNIAEVRSYVKHHSYMVVAVVSWVVMGLLTLGVVLPSLGSLAQTSSVLGQKEKEFEATKTKVEFLLGLDKDLLKTRVTMLQTVLPSVKPVMPFIASIERLGGLAGVTVKSIELAPGKVSTESGKIEVTGVTKSAVSGVYALPLRMEVNGSFLAMNEFFKSLDNVVPLVNVKTIQFAALNRTSVNETDPQYKATVELESLFILGDDKVGKDATIRQLAARDNDLLGRLEGMVEAAATGSATILPTSSFVPRENVFAY